MSRSRLATVAFPWMAWGLAFHSLVMAILFGPLHMSAARVRMIAAWKEVALVGLLAVVIHRALAGRGPRVSLAWTDFWIGGLISTAIIYFVSANLWLGANLPLDAQLLGFRQAVYFMLIYFVGRATPEVAEDERTIRLMFALLVVTCVIGILERFLVPPQGLVAIGVAAYFQDFLGAAPITAGNEYGLPTNYWAYVGGHAFRRAGSVYLSGQGFAVPFLLFFPLATVWVFARPHVKVRQVIGYTIVCVALLLTLTRMTILVALLQLILFLVMRRRPEWAVAGLVLFGVLFLAALVVVPGLPGYTLATITGQETSAASHVSDWINGATAFFEQPWGAGLGVTDASATRAGLGHVAGDNLYWKYAVEMGLFGLLLFLFTLGGIIANAFNVFRNGITETQRNVGAVVWLAA
ncbi:MAG TPA: O-antigen ligase family protein, partial [Gemmatimonadaceae bacterium]|nr:O-antigen ligase family protein [Gemmatimonadaceae bacterium]